MAITPEQGKTILEQMDLPQTKRAGFGLSQHRLFPASAGLLGFVDYLTSQSQAFETRLTVGGWIFHPEKKIREVYIRIGNGPWCQSGLKIRPDVFASYSGHTTSILSGFHCEVLLNRSAPYFSVEPKVEAKVVFLGGGSAVVSFRQGTAIPPEKQIGFIGGDPDRGSLFRKAWLTQAQQSFDTFVKSGARIGLPVSTRPLLSVILVSYNQPELLLKVLASLLTEINAKIEVLIYDNASGKKTQQFLKQIDGAKIILGGENLHFLKAANAAAEKARGKYLLFLNSDCELFPGALHQSLEIMKSNPKIGVLGPMILNCDLSVQEAGSYIQTDGSTMAYGRNSSSVHSDVTFRRSVDFVSGAFLFTPRSLFRELKGFDVRFAPAYYEDVDYCLRARKAGRDVVYDPQIKTIHYLHGSNRSNPESPRQLMIKNRQVLLEAHPEISNTKKHTVSYPEIFLRSASPNKKILYIDLDFPLNNLGGGFPRGNQIIQALLKLNWDISIFPLRPSGLSIDEIRAEIPVEVELITEKNVGHLREFIASRPHFYDAIFVSRPECVGAFRRECASSRPHLSRTKIIFDVEAVQTLREVDHYQVLSGGQATFPESARLQTEMALYQGADRISAVSAKEKALLQRFLQAPVTVLPFCHFPVRPKTPFRQRKHFLFVGPTYDPHSPNFDSLVWFIDEIWPGIRSGLGADVRLKVIGRTHPEIAARNAKKGIDFLERQEDLTPFYEGSRVLVAPTRFAAGIPHKVTEAASMGLPVVGTPVLAEQLGWRRKHEMMVANSASGFARDCITLYSTANLWSSIQKQAQKAIEAGFNEQLFVSSLNSLLS